MLIIILFAVVLGTFLAAFVISDRYLQKRDTTKMRDRLLDRVPTEKPGGSSEPLLRGQDSRAKSGINRLLARFKLDRRLEEMIEQAGLRWSPGRTALAIVILVIGGFDVAWYTLPYFKSAALVAGVLAGSLPLLYIWRRRRTRLAGFEAQFPDALEFASRSMRAGHAFSVSLEMLHQEFADPLGGEFRRTFDEQNLGLPLDLALEK